MTDRADRPVFWPAVATWTAVAVALAAVVSRGEIEPALFVEAPVLASMLVYIVGCEAFPAEERGVLRRLGFLVGAAVAQVVGCVVIGFLLMPLWALSPFLGLVLGCVLPALPFVIAATYRSALFEVPVGLRVGRRTP